MNPRTSMAQREDIIRRTVTEEQLDSLFIGFGQTLVVCFYVVRLRKAENFNLVLSLAWAFLTILVYMHEENILNY
ncbi:hypothetical protein Bca101_005600 [Brassica carinata]